MEILNRKQVQVDQSEVCQYVSLQNIATILRR